MHLRLTCPQCGESAAYDCPGVDDSPYESIDECRACGALTYARISLDVERGVMALPDDVPAIKEDVSRLLRSGLGLARIRTMGAHPAVIDLLKQGGVR